MHGNTEKKIKELNHALHCIPESLYTELKTLHLSLGLNWVFLKKKKINKSKCEKVFKDTQNIPELK